jgi:hypothetical protein
MQYTKKRQNAMTEALASSHVKVVLEVERDDGAFDLESVWAVPEAEGYRLDNIPFYARGVALGDVVRAVADPDGLLRCVNLIGKSGHSTVRLWVEDARNVAGIRQYLRDARCSSELELDRLIAVDIPPDVEYSMIRKYFEDGERAGLFEYEEGCLAQSPSGN